MKKQVCSSLLALTMALGTVTPALAAEIETNVQPAACTCTAACTEETRNMDCAVCGAEGAPLTDCAQVNAQDDTNKRTADSQRGKRLCIHRNGRRSDDYRLHRFGEEHCDPVGAGRQAGHDDCG